jgi:hypothetical protein
VGVSFDKQLREIKDRDEFHRVIDQLTEGGIALLIARNVIDGEPSLRICSYGHAYETDILGLMGYASVILHREYFTDDE